MLLYLIFGFLTNEISIEILFGEFVEIDNVCEVLNNFAVNQNKIFESEIWLGNQLFVEYNNFLLDF